MTLDEKRAAISRKQKEIDSYPWEPIFKYPFCCICFEELNQHNIVEKYDHLIDVCLECIDK